MLTGHPPKDAPQSSQEGPSGAEDALGDLWGAGRIWIL